MCWQNLIYDSTSFPTQQHDCLSCKRMGGAFLFAAFTRSARITRARSAIAVLGPKVRWTFAARKSVVGRSFLFQIDGLKIHKIISTKRGNTVFAELQDLPKYKTRGVYFSSMKKAGLLDDTVPVSVTAAAHRPCCCCTSVWQTQRKLEISFNFGFYVSIQKCLRKGVRVLLNLS